MSLRIRPLTWVLIAVLVAAAVAFVVIPGPDEREAFAGKDAARERIEIRLTEVAHGLSQITDVQFVPNEPTVAWVLEKDGRLVWVDVATGETRTLHQFAVSTVSELGLLGLAFHPKFPAERRFFIDRTVPGANGKDFTLIEQCSIPAGAGLHEGLFSCKTLIEQEQPYQNHNAGQLVFGPDGLLYVGFGDGGSGGDPHGNGQNPGTLLGKMLRLDVDGESLVPKDNPFVGREGFRPEIFALGLRNPWRYSFDPKGRLIVADVGENKYEELDFVAAGDNLGWNSREGFHCYAPETGCRTEGLREPFYEYEHDEGQSITGGYVVLSDRIPALKNKYVFGDFVRGRLWAIELPAKPEQRVTKVFALGAQRANFSTFGRDAAGNLYVADFTGERLLRVDP